MSARVIGVTVRHEPKRALPWGLYVDARIGGERVSGTKFFATEAEAEAQYPVAAADITRRRTQAEQQAALQKALNVPVLPEAPRGKVLFETLTTKWLDEYVKESFTAATYRNYKGLLDRYLLPIMRSWPVDDRTMEKTRIKFVLREQLYKAGVPLPTRRACQRCLSACFNWIESELPGGLLTRNPASKLGKFLRQKDEKHVILKPQPNPMTRVQVEAFLTWQEQHYPELADLFLWLADEGSRIGEVCALKWAHLKLDTLDRGKANIVEAFSSATRWQERQDGDERGLGEKDTKTHRTDQWIDLTRRVVVRMRARKAANLEAWMARGRYGKEPVHCFLTRDLLPRRPDKKLYRAFREGCDALQLRGETGKPFTIHCLRDTFASLALLEGKALGEVSMMLGHANVKTTQDHYVKWLRLADRNIFDVAKGGEE